MSIHRSLKNKNKKRKSVRSRLERYVELIKKGLIPKSPFALPKEKIIEFKIKKEKKEKTVEGIEPLLIPTTPDPKSKKKSKDVGKIK